jgi:hypothetical protein
VGEVLYLLISICFVFVCQKKKNFKNSFSNVKARLFRTVFGAIES